MSFAQPFVWGPLCVEPLYVPLALALSCNRWPEYSFYATIGIKDIHTNADMSQAHYVRAEKARSTFPSTSVLYSKLVLNNTIHLVMATHLEVGQVWQKPVECAIKCQVTRRCLTNLGRHDNEGARSMIVSNLGIVPTLDVERGSDTAVQACSGSWRKRR